MSNVGSPVLSKADFAERYARGEFGNHSPTYRTLEEFHTASYRLRVRDLLRWITTTYSLRATTQGWKTHYNLVARDVVCLWEGAKKTECYKAAKVYQGRDLTETSWYASEMAPHDRQTIQGEVFRSPSGLYLYYTDVQKPMKPALAEKSMEAVGLSAKLLLQRYLDWNSYDWLMYLLDTYEDHVVEFSAFSSPWGSLYPLFNTVFWEVRYRNPWLIGLQKGY